MLESRSQKLLKRAGAVKPYLMGAGKNPLKMASRSRDSVPRGLEPDLFRAGAASKKPGARPFLEGAGAESRQLPNTGINTVLIVFDHFKFLGLKVLI